MSHEARKGRNEAWFRELNERLEERAVARLGLAEAFELVCECALEECTERITVSFAEYEAVRSEPTHFIVIPAHRDSGTELIVSSAETYDVVEKIGDAGREAAHEDPRGPAHPSRPAAPDAGSA